MDSKKQLVNSLTPRRDTVRHTLRRCSEIMNPTSKITTHFYKVRVCSLSRSNYPFTDGSVAHTSRYIPKKLGIPNMKLVHSGRRQMKYYQKQKIDSPLINPFIP